VIDRSSVVTRLAGFADVVLTLFVLPAGLLLKGVRRVGLHRLPLCRRILLRIGVLPIRQHYYEPLFREVDSRLPPGSERALPGIDWNIPAQMALLESLSFASELEGLKAPRTAQFQFRLNNGSFESGDAEFLYQMIRLKKPRRFFEIGSGSSTLIARQAIVKNREEDPGYDCKHLCIEPFEAPWLEAAGIYTLRKKVEEVEPELFAELAAGDFLFIDSSHVIRPQGDVLTEYLEILPKLRKGVIVHVHDIFSPRDYPPQWLYERIWLWNEQYLLEAFLTGSSEWKILGALNWLRHHDFNALRRVCPFLTADREPGSFYIQKVQ
jgi:Methyltransferase domain